MASDHPADLRPGSKHLLLFLAATTFGLSAGQPLPLPYLIVIGVVLLTLGGLLPNSPIGGRLPTVVPPVVVALVAALPIAGRTHPLIGQSPPWLYQAQGVAWLAFALLLARTRPGPSRRRLLPAVVLGLTLGFGAATILTSPTIEIDVYLLHQAGATAIAAGESPYSEAVRVPNAAPGALVGSTIAGYPYPPITAVAFAIGELAFGDPRWLSLLAWLAVISALFVVVSRSGWPDLGVWTILLLAALPAWPFVLLTSWTEPLSLALLASAAVLWRRPGRSGVALGLALASKQYFALGLTLLFNLPGAGKWRRLAGVALGLLASFVPLIWWRTDLFSEAAIRFHLSTPVRADGTSIPGLLARSGLNWQPGTAWSVGVPLAIGALLAVRIRHTGDFFAGLAIVLACGFLLSSQAFANYWFLIAGLSSLSVANWDRLSDWEPAADAS